MADSHPHGVSEERFADAIEVNDHISSSQTRAPPEHHTSALEDCATLKDPSSDDPAEVVIVTTSNRPDFIRVPSDETVTQRSVSRKSISSGVQHDTETLDIRFRPSVQDSLVKQPVPDQKAGTISIKSHITNVFTVPLSADSMAVGVGAEGGSHQTRSPPSTPCTPANERYVLMPAHTAVHAPREFLLTQRVRHSSPRNGRRMEADDVRRPELRSGRSSPHGREESPVRPVGSVFSVNQAGHLRSQIVPLDHPTHECTGSEQVDGPSAFDLGRRLELSGQASQETPGEKAQSQWHSWYSHVHRRAERNRNTMDHFLTDARELEALVLAKLKLRYGSRSIHAPIRWVSSIWRIFHSAVRREHTLHKQTAQLMDRWESLDRSYASIETLAQGIIYNEPKPPGSARSDDGMTELADHLHNASLGPHRPLPANPGDLTPQTSAMGAAAHIRFAQVKLQETVIKAQSHCIYNKWRVLVAQLDQLAQMDALEIEKTHLGLF